MKGNSKISMVEVYESDTIVGVGHMRLRVLHSKETGQYYRCVFLKNGACSVKEAGTNKEAAIKDLLKLRAQMDALPPLFRTPGHDKTH